MSGLRRTHRRDEIKDVYGPGVIPTATHAPGERAPRHDPHLQEGMATRSKRQARFWSAILSRLLLGMGFGALGSLMVNCALVEISLSPLFAVAFGAQCPIYAQCPVPLRSPMPNLCPMPIRLANTTTRYTLPAVRRHGRVDGGARARRWGEPCAAAWFCSAGEHVWGALLSARARLVAWPESRRQGAALPFVMNQHATARDHEITAQQGPDPSPS